MTSSVEQKMDETQEEQQTEETQEESYQKIDELEVTFSSFLINFS